MQWGKKSFEKNILAIKPGAFRLFLAVLVVFHHGLRIFPYGAFAVCTFFILSGYWVAKMYNEFYLKRDNSYWTFMYSRVLRLFPLYWLCTLLLIVICNYFLLQFYQIDIMPKMGVVEALYMILLVPLNLLPFKFLNPSWSLAVEMQFYFLAPLLLLMLKKFNFYVLSAVILIISVYFSLVISVKTNETVLPYLIYFFIGMIIYHRKLVVSKYQVFFSLLAALGFIFLSYAIPALRQSLIFKTLLFNSIDYYSIFNYTLPFLFVPFIINNLKQKSDKMDRHLGDFSYTIYLVHWIVFTVYFQLYKEGGFSSAKMIGFGITLAIVFLLSFIIYYFFEKWVEKFRKQLIKSK